MKLLLPVSILTALLLAPGCTETLVLVCGDGGVDEGEACDDGNLLGGDGCTHLCTAEVGEGEVEPNDEPGDATLLAGVRVNGTLRPGDRDCFALAVSEAGSVRARVLPAAGESCDFEVLVELLDPDGTRVSSGLPSPPLGCAVIDPDTDTWARYLGEGEHTVCVESTYGEPVASYTLEVELADSCTELPELTPDPAQDLEGDGIADVCDPDDDNDGVDDAVDNCPTAPNGPEQPIAWGTSVDGFVNLWLILGAFTEGVAPEGCLPSPGSFAAADDAEAAPALGDRVGDVPWFAHYIGPGSSAVVRFTQWFGELAPREAYAATWVFAPDARDAELTVGADDGHRAWLNGVEVGSEGGCHGIGVDAFRYPVSLEDGWNRLLLKVHDGGGGWGYVVRFYELDGATPMADLELSIGGPEPWVDDQGDGDGDGIGDFCDPEP